MTAFALAVAAVIGSLIGSFLNAWSYRLPRGISVARGRSMCPWCGAQIRGYDNVPVVSWLVLRGRCRDCGERISWRYPAVELLVAGLYALVVWHDGVAWVLVPHLVFVTAVVMVSLVDLVPEDEGGRIIPDVVILPVAAAGAVVMPIVGDRTWWTWWAWGVGAAGALLAIALLYQLVRRQEGMGMGDVKMALCMGVYLGSAVVPALFIGVIAGAVVGVAQMALAGRDMKQALPFGPFLALGAIVSLFLGEALIDLYLGLVFR